MVRKYALVAVILATQLSLYGGVLGTAFRSVRGTVKQPLVRNLGTTAKDAGLTTTRQNPNTGLLLNVPFGTSCRHFSTRTPNFGPRVQRAGNQQGGWRNWNWQHGWNQLKKASLGGATVMGIGFLSGKAFVQLNNTLKATAPAETIADETMSRSIVYDLNKKLALLKEKAARGDKVSAEDIDTALRRITTCQKDADPLVYWAHFKGLSLN